MLTGPVSLCAHEMKASAVMYSPVTSAKTNPAELEVHRILLVMSGREDESPRRVSHIRFVTEMVCARV